MIFSITGKSGSGKTYLAKQLAPLFDAKIISFDEISHQVLENKNVLIEIKEIFGKEVFDKNNKLSRKKLGKIVFADSKKLEILNNLVWHKMEDVIDDILSKNCKDNFILEYALLPKMKYFETSDLKILVKANIHSRKTRIIKRDNISEDYFLSRDANSLEFNEQDYDIIVDNTENIDINQIYKQIKEALCSEKQ